MAVKYDKLFAVLKERNMKDAWKALMAAAQEPNPEDIIGNTQWSILFDNTNGTAEITLRRQWEDRYSFEIGN